jgi:hypothetical protein
MATAPRRRAADKNTRATDVAPDAKPQGFTAEGNPVLIVTLERIQEATISGSFVYLAPEQVEIFGISVETNPALVHNGDYVAARASASTPQNPVAETGDIAPQETEMSEVQTQAAETVAEKPKANFEVFENFELPKGRKPGNGNTKYPFESLEIGGAFFVPGGSVKALASTVASANARYAEVIKHPDGTPVTRTNRKGNVTNATKLVRKFQVRAGKHPKTGEEGAFIGRVAVPTAE